MNAVPAWSAVGVIGMLFVSEFGTQVRRVSGKLSVSHMTMPNHGAMWVWKFQTGPATEPFGGRRPGHSAASGRSGRCCRCPASSRRTRSPARRGRRSGRCPRSAALRRLSRAGPGTATRVVRVLGRAIAVAVEEAGVLGATGSRWRGDDGRRHRSRYESDQGQANGQPTSAHFPPPGSSRRISSETRNLVRPRGRVKGQTLQFLAGWEGQSAWSNASVATPIAIVTTPGDLDAVEPLAEQEERGDRRDPRELRSEDGGDRRAVARPERVRRRACDLGEPDEDHGRDGRPDDAQTAHQDERDRDEDDPGDPRRQDRPRQWQLRRDAARRVEVDPEQDGRAQRDQGRDRGAHGRPLRHPPAGSPGARTRRAPRPRR